MLGKTGGTRGFRVQRRATQLRHLVEALESRQLLAFVEVTVGTVAALQETLDSPQRNPGDVVVITVQAGTYDVRDIGSLKITKPDFIIRGQAGFRPLITRPNDVGLDSTVLIGPGDVEPWTPPF